MLFFYVVWFGMVYFFWPLIFFFSDAFSSGMEYCFDVDIIFFWFSILSYTKVCWYDFNCILVSAPFNCLSTCTCLLDVRCFLAYYLIPFSQFSMTFFLHLFFPWPNSLYFNGSYILRIWFSPHKKNWQLGMLCSWFNRRIKPLF